MRNLICLLFTALLLYSCVSWDSGVSKEDKAAFLFNKLNEEYQNAYNEGDLLTIRDIPKKLEWVYKLDESKKDQVFKLISTIESNLEIMKKNSKKKAVNYVMKKDYFNAAFEYSMIIEFEPENSDAVMFFKNNDDKIKEVVVKIKIEIKKSISENNFVQAENKLNKLKIIIPRDSELKLLVVEVNKKKQNTVQTVTYEKKNKIKEDPEIYYKTALKAYNDMDYSSAKREIRKYRHIKEDQKSLELYNKINAEIKRIVNELMPDAILNYNSQKFDEALKLFNRVLELENNEDAMDYKIRIEKKLKALDIL